MNNRSGTGGGGAISFRGVSKAFGSGDTHVLAVDNVSVDIGHGEFCAVMGPSGSGKSTMLHLIAGLTTPTRGEILVDGVEIATATPSQAAILRRRRVGYVLQSFNLLPFLSAAENVEMPLLLDGIRQDEIDVRVREALEMVDMGHRATHLPAQLSGGEQQRVAIARALAIRPAIILADEPTGNLDRANGTAVMDLIKQINEQTGVTVLMVTHDPLFAAYSHRLIRLVDGAIEQEIDVPEAAGLAVE